jgi:hypothetical protein
MLGNLVLRVHANELSDECSKMSETDCFNWVVFALIAVAAWRTSNFDNGDADKVEVDVEVEEEDDEDDMVDGDS